MELNNVVVRRANTNDLEGMVHVNMECFHGDRGSPRSAAEWLSCRSRSFPLYQFFVAEVDGKVAGYVGWEIHGGFRRPEPVVELEQIGFLRDFQSQGLGTTLQEKSMEMVAEWVKQENDRIESHVSFIVWVYAGNLRAQATYFKAFPEGVQGMRIQYGDRTEVMLRSRLPVVVPVPREKK